MGLQGGELIGEWRRLLNKELNDLYFSPNTIPVIKSRRMRQAWHLACAGKRRGAYRVLVGRPKEQRPLGRLCVDERITLKLTNLTLCVPFIILQCVNNQ